MVVVKEQRCVAHIAPFELKLATSHSHMLMKLSTKFQEQRKPTDHCAKQWACSGGEVQKLSHQEKKSQLMSDSITFTGALLLDTTT